MWKKVTPQQLCEALRDAWPGFIILWDPQCEDLLFIFLNEKSQPEKKKWMKKLILGRRQLMIVLVILVVIWELENALKSDNFKKLDALLCSEPADKAKTILNQITR